MTLQPQRQTAQENMECARYAMALNAIHTMCTVYTFGFSQ